MFSVFTCTFTISQIFYFVSVTASRRPWVTSSCCGVSLILLSLLFEHSVRCSYEVSLHAAGTQDGVRRMTAALYLVVRAMTRLFACLYEIMTWLSPVKYDVLLQRVDAALCSYPIKRGQMFMCKVKGKNHASIPWTGCFVEYFRCLA